MHSLGILNEERVEKSVLYRPVSGVLSWAVDAVFNKDEDAHKVTHHNGSGAHDNADSDSDQSDTVWVQRDGSIKR